MSEVTGEALTPPFALNTMDGTPVSFPGDKPSLVCFVKEDCPTCNLVMPLINTLHTTYGDAVDVLVVGQTLDGNRLLAENHALSVALLDDSSLKVSFAWDIEIVPMVFYCDSDGRLIRRLEGFARQEWESLIDVLRAATGTDCVFNWYELPEWRPGCGSLSVDPVISDRLRAEAENSPLRARKIEIAPADDEAEFMFDQGFTDGLPVVAPTPERVVRMLSGTRRDPQELIAEVPPNMGPATVEKIAINAVLAGCKPAYLPVVIAAVQAACTDKFNIHGVMATTMGASPVMVVNGPIRQQLDMNMGLGALGRGNRANASIGRALRLCIQNIGGSRMGGTDRSTLGSPMKFTMCFPEFEERSNWQPMHVERGFAADESVVTLFPGTGFQQMVDQKSRDGDRLAGSMALMMNGVHHPRAHNMMDCLLIVCPEHVDTFARSGYSKADLRKRIQQVTSVPLRELQADAVSGEGLDPEKAAQLPPDKLDTLMPKFLSEDMIHIVVAGSDAGKFSGLIHGWVGGEIGSIPVSQKIED